MPTSKKGRKLRLFNAALLVLAALISGLLIFSIFKNNVLAFHHLNLIITVVLGVVVLLSSFFVWKNIFQVFTLILLFLFLTVIETIRVSTGTETDIFLASSAGEIFNCKSLIA